MAMEYYAVTFSCFDMDGDGAVTSHDVFTCIKMGHARLLGNDILSLSKCIGDGVLKRLKGQHNEQLLNRLRKRIAIQEIDEVRWRGVDLSSIY